MNLIFEGDIFESQADEEDIESKMDKESLTVEDHQDSESNSPSPKEGSYHAKSL